MGAGRWLRTLDGAQDMVDKRSKKSLESTVEIVPLRELRRITLRCTGCGQMSLMDIRQKVRFSGRVTYYVRCPRCGCEFKQIGRPPNFSRNIKQRYGFSSAQLRLMKTEMIRKIIKTGEIVAKETEKTIQAGDVDFIKPTSRRTPK